MSAEESRERITIVAFICCAVFGTFSVRGCYAYAIAESAKPQTATPNHEAACRDTVGSFCGPFSNGFTCPHPSHRMTRDGCTVACTCRLAEGGAQ